ncbi:uncharacterized protein LOC107042088 [Diachasma alloeum]|uniref:uncharacterized protein LOC107042088 n=1 Tax=Diachasma alloeum TaxID=454923 RepID=UPI00073846D0|nr:uncharacterized protein LOC107042088 [Diachasma alloeum]
MAISSVDIIEIPLISVIFRLIVLHFQEKDELFRFEEENLTDEQLLENIPNLTPVLVIKGRSLYDETATHAVALDKKILIPVNGVLDGILLLFSLYYVFRVLYPDTLSRTLEFIQRCLLRMNPKTGHKRASKKQKATPFDLKVKKFIDGLQQYIEHP